MRRRVPGIGMRVKLAAATMVIVGIALVVGTVIVSLALYTALMASVTREATGQLSAVVEVISREGVDGLSSATGAEVALGASVQLLGPDGSVVYSTNGNTPLTTARPGVGEVVLTGASPLPAPTEDPGLVVAATGVAYDGRSGTAVLAVSQDSQYEAVDTVLKLLLAGTPLIVLVAGAVAWWLVSRSLQPVEDIRTTVESISSRHLEARVPISDVDDEIGRLALTMNAMLDRLERGRRQQDQFVADASHELRSPLASLHTALEMGTGDPSGRRWQDLAPVMSTETRRMERLVDDLLTLARGDAGMVTSGRWRDVDLDDLVVEEARRPRGAGRVEVLFEVEPTRIRGDRLQLVRVLRNLADNAVRAAASRVVLSVEADGAAAVLRVEDDGPGIPPEERERVFERFVRLDTARTRDEGGSGLGLAIVHELVTNHGGTVAVDASALGGARFTVRLPLDSPDPGQPAAGLSTTR
ncbi:HAMP domain-containing sensor histidine kinase [Raineyella sp. LH-20]|uniref:sensor histidine kinase n=1 Tax=Raineyella sp. LH-20 TaxID=3081204 RepID=UPI002954B7AC|nr:HAMP domain-containing sensor histidine kinase [Raineyella sp. LH-20]WOP19463.1 HAMP domain-containing sensor histidine kinase [Raineyella sp. LH-20]